jgi:hypothetical protein
MKPAFTLLTAMLLAPLGALEGGAGGDGAHHGHQPPSPGPRAALDGKDDRKRAALSPFQSNP